MGKLNLFRITPLFLVSGILLFGCSTKEKPSTVPENNTPPSQSNSSTTPQPNQPENEKKDNATSDISIDFIKQNLNIGDSEEKVKTRFGDQFTKVVNVHDGNPIWRYDFIADKTYTFKHEYVDSEGIKNGRMKMQLFVEWPYPGNVETQIVTRYSIFFKGQDGKVHQYSKDAKSEREVPIE
ncbi:hypothetical protein [Effusibacillus dendaii]|uniref:Lipoprotein n=1 Tax=Effusibacillus dendaii TaxID=2743772 RepID=A0A7I8DAP8_9BACL|nr:hypothetical protein [Effusibacillus dendaii]BCJ85896.1 hypothetical protein skT53_08810 [Effusibacillus dendaii]